MTVVLEARNITREYGEVMAVQGVSLEARSGEILGIVGPSGAGKSTVLRIMDLLERPSSGFVRMMGRAVVADSKEADEVRLGIGMVLQKPVVLNRSVKHNLSYGLELRGVDPGLIEKKVDSELHRIGLAERITKNARTLSGGEMQRLSFTRATIYDPKLLLLDEFSANLDPKNVGIIEADVRRYLDADRSRAVVMVTHNMFQARRLCDRLALLWNGYLIETADKKSFFEAPQDERTAAFVRGDLVY
jgi:tungstate transport system ATP-binding protein